MTHYPQLTEQEILNKDWGWVERRLELIQSTERAKMRWDLQARLVSAAAAFSGGEAMSMFEEMYNATFTDAERTAQIEEEERRAQEELEKQRKERMEAARKSGGKATLVRM
jgi:hypothetical protein